MKTSEPLPLSVPVSPTGPEITAHLRELKRRHPELVKVSTLATTKRGNPVEAAAITDPSTPASQKQHALILAGRHGNEESGRMQALALMDWLVTGAAAETIRNQKIVIMPNLNPDAAAIDSYWNPDGINVCAELTKRRKRCPEDLAFEKVVHGLQPEAVVDLHCKGHAGWSFDMVLYNEPRKYTEDHNALSKVVHDMVTAGEKTGAPHMSHPMSWPGWIGEGASAYCYSTFKSLALLTETSESNTHRPDEKTRIRTGLARLKALLKWGNRKHDGLYHEGYPFSLVLGSCHAGIVARGRTASARRKSRVEIWQQADHFERISKANPEKEKDKEVTLAYTGPPVLSGIGLQTRSRGRMQVESVRFNGKKLRESETNGYVSWQDHCSTHVIAFVPRIEKGNHELRIAFR